MIAFVRGRVAAVSLDGERVASTSNRSRCSPSPAMTVAPLLALPRRPLLAWRLTVLARPEMPRYAYIFRFKGDGVRPIEREDCR